MPSSFVGSGIASFKLISNDKPTPGKCWLCKIPAPSKGKCGTDLCDKTVTAFIDQYEMCCDEDPSDPDLPLAYQILMRFNESHLGIEKNYTVIWSGKYSIIPNKGVTCRTLIYHWRTRYS